MPVLFVYGTLRRPVGGPEADTHYHHRIADAIEVAKMATLHGAAIYDLGNYPGIGPADETSSVRGEVFEIDDEALLIADEIEGHPNFYERTEASVVLDDGMGGPAWVYWAPESALSEGTLISSGDWFDRPRTAVAMSIDEQLDAAKPDMDDG